VGLDVTQYKSAECGREKGSLGTRWGGGGGRESLGTYNATNVIQNRADYIYEFTRKTASLNVGSERVSLHIEILKTVTRGHINLFSVGGAGCWPDCIYVKISTFSYTEYTSVNSLELLTKKTFTSN